MILDIPILIETLRDSTEKNVAGSHLFQARPLFFSAPTASGKNLDFTVTELASKIHDTLKRLLTTQESDELTRWTFSPEATLRRQEVLLELPRRFARLHAPLATFESDDRHIAFCPLINELYFEFAGLDTLPFRAEEVLREHFRNVRKKSGDEGLDEQLRELEQPRQFRLSYVEISFDPARELRQSRSKDSSRQEELIRSGKDHLEQVGLNLDRLYPKQLSPAVCRNGLVDQVFRRLTEHRKNAVLLVGPPKVGKTAILHATVARMVEEIPRPDHEPYRHSVWQLTPGRLIAGMSRAGQWESRLNAIFAYAKSRQITLNFTQLVALLNTGKSASGSLSMADLLLQSLRRRRFRVIAEATEEQLRVLRERNRALADQFEIIHVQEPGEDDTLRILLHATRELEWTWKCSFDVDLLPLVIDVTRQYENDVAMPGKAVHWFTALAMQYQGEEIDRGRFLDLFREKSGLPLTFFDTGTQSTPGEQGRRGQSTPAEIDRWFASRIIGQRPAIAAMRDVILTADALLSDPERPIASLFFLGPTGVGKTECAKQLARFFFGDEDRLLRLDANELCTAAAVARLVGAHQSGEGILTGAIRRQPFSVVLFDEIEKGHPDLFDLLLQVVGEARLSDTQGRVASFAQAIVIFTSNLGTREAANRLGFGTRNDSPSGRDDAAYLRAVKEFFRPEFVNRIDRIVPFSFLSPDEMEQIARRMFDEIISREGLRRRRARLLITPQALRALTQSGSADPVYGARGMQRILYRDLVAPVSRFLASPDGRLPAVVEVTRAKVSTETTMQPLLDIRSFRLAPPKTLQKNFWSRLDELDSLPRTRREEILKAARLALLEIYETILPFRPSRPLDAGSIAGLTPAETLYYQAVDECSELRQLVEELLENEQARTGQSMPLHTSRKPNKHSNAGYDQQRFWKHVQADDDLQSALDELFAAHRREEHSGGRIGELLKRISGLHEMVRTDWNTIRRIAVLTLTTEETVALPEIPEQPLLARAWRRRVITFPWSEETGGVILNEKEISLAVFEGPGTIEYWTRQEGTRLIFHDETIAAEARLVFIHEGTDADLLNTLHRRLNDPARKWPEVNRVSGRNRGDFETVAFSDDNMRLPESLTELFPVSPDDVDAGD